MDIYDITNGHNPELLDQCKALNDYETFVELIRKHKKKTGDLRKAVKLAAAECKNKGILEHFLQTYASEVENMVLTEWNWKEAKEVWVEEGREEGMEKGREEGMEKVFALLEQGIPLEKAKKMLMTKHRRRK